MTIRRIAHVILAVLTFAFTAACTFYLFYFSFIAWRLFNEGDTQKATFYLALAMWTHLIVGAPVFQWPMKCRK